MEADRDDSFAQPEHPPLIEEVTRAVVTTNEKRSEKVDDITSNVSGCLRERFGPVLAGDLDCGPAALRWR